MKRLILISISLVILVAMSVSIASADSNRALIFRYPDTWALNAFDEAGNFYCVLYDHVEIVTQDGEGHITVRGSMHLKPGNQYEGYLDCAGDPVLFTAASPKTVCENGYLAWMFGDEVAAKACRGDGTIVFNSNLVPDLEFWFYDRLAEKWQCTISADGRYSVIWRVSNP